MSWTLYLGINGHTYELAYQAESEWDPRRHELDKKLDALATGQGVVSFDYKASNEAPVVRLRVNAANVVTMAAWAEQTAEHPAPSGGQRHFAQPARLY